MHERPELHTDRQTDTHTHTRARAPLDLNPSLDKITIPRSTILISRLKS